MATLEPDGIWCDVRTDRRDGGIPALFLDRDGTLIEEGHFLHKPDEVRLICEAVKAVNAANDTGWPVVIVTNQSGIGRGIFGWTDFEDVQVRLYDLLTAAGATIDACYACPHAPEDKGGPAVSPYRKPAPGMFLRAGQDLGVDLSRSWIVGDAPRDLAAGKAAGLAGGCLVSTGHGARQDQREAAQALAGSGFEVTVSGAFERVRRVIGQTSRGAL